MSLPGDPLSALLEATPLTPSIQKHLRLVYSTLFTCFLVATVGAVLDLSTRLPLGRIATFLLLPSLFYFRFQPALSKRREYALYLFALLDGLSAGPLVSLAADFDARVPAVALCGCALVFAGLTVSALFARRRSYLFLGAGLWTALWGLLLVGVVNAVFVRSERGWVWGLYGGLVVMCGFVLYDTQRIVEKAARVGGGDYVGDAMQLLVDFMGVFKRVLILMIRNQERKRAGERRKTCQ